MALSNRHKTLKLNDKVNLDIIKSDKSLREIARSDPLSNYYTNQVTGTDARTLAMQIIALQTAKFGGSVLNLLPYPALERNIKLLLKEYSVQQVQQAVALAQQRAGYVYSTKLIKELIQWVEGLRNV